MNEQQALSRMVAPGQHRPGKWRGGVIQVWVTRACDKSCFNCTQGANYAGKPGMITVKQFEQALLSMRGYFGVVGMFGGNPATHPDFYSLCSLMRQHIPREQRGIWCNNPITPQNAQIMHETFNPAVSNLNVHLDPHAWAMFRGHWPESRPFGMDRDSRHAPVFVSMKDLGIPEEERWELISRCDINQHWSAMIGVFRGELRAWFCEIAGSMSMLHQDDPKWPDTGMHVRLDVPVPWWKMPMEAFKHQVRQHCHSCGVPLRGYGQLAQASDELPEQVSQTHANLKSKRRRPLEMVTDRKQLHEGSLARMTDYIGNSSK